MIINIFLIFIITITPGYCEHECTFFAKYSACRGNNVTLSRQECTPIITVVNDAEITDVSRCLIRNMTLKFTIGCPIFLIANCDLNIHIEPEECRVSVLLSVI
jgi:hypothetical protein